MSLTHFRTADRTSPAVIPAKVTSHTLQEKKAQGKPIVALTAYDYATARLVAYGTGCTSQATAPDAPQDPGAGYDTCKVMQVLDVVTGKLISFPAPQGTAGWVPNGFDLVSAISPDDQLIAAYAAIRPQGPGQVRLYVMRIAGPARRAMPVPSSVAYLFARTAWSPADSWLLYQGPGGHLWAYQVTSAQTRASSTPCCRYTVLAATPSRSG